jgi:Mg2+-importing ATPase
MPRKRRLATTRKGAEPVHPRSPDDRLPLRPREGLPPLAPPLSEAGAQACAFWATDIQALLAELGSTPQGLSQAEAAERLKRYGLNLVEERRELNALRLLIRQFESPLVLILVFGALVALFLRELLDATIVILIVLGSCMLGFFQEFNASRAVEKLRERLALSVTALRDGTRQSLSVIELVPGDIIELAAGNLIPADGRILSGRDFLVSEATLTGESFPVEKSPGVVAPDTPLSARSNSVFLGTSVRSGTATVLIAATGRATALGAIAARLESGVPETEFARGVRQFGYLLLQVMVVIVLFVLTINLMDKRPVTESLLFAVALAVGLSPELLPAIVSVTLSAGARAMAARGVIVRRLEAIENLGSMDVLCTDKTGTLTEGNIVLEAALAPDGSLSDNVAELAAVNASLQTGIENPLDAAIVASTPGSRISNRYQKVDEIPYDFQRRRLTVVVAEKDTPAHRIITKGAYTHVLDCCTTLLRDGSAVRLDAATRARLDAFFQTKGSEGFRVLGVAAKTCEPQEAYGRRDEQGMTFAGFLLFRDPIKADIMATLADLARLGIRIKIVTGDNRYVAAHVAEAIGLKGHALLTGERLQSLSDAALWHRVQWTDVFAEIDPQQKERIVHALQRAGHAVGYLGDGINDAPALYEADVGISVDQAVDVARESADIILVQRDLDALRAGVEDGRRTFANTLKYISITTSANFGNMLSMALATLFLPFLPLLPKQILLNNFLSDFPSVAISTDNVDPGQIERSQRWNITEVRSFMIVFGITSTVFDLVTFVLLLRIFMVDEPTFQTGWFVVSLLTELVVVLVLRTRQPFYRSRPSMILLSATIGMALLAVALPYSGPGAEVFSFTALSPAIFAASLVIVVAYVATTEVLKVWFYRHFVRHRRPRRRSLYSR